MMAIVSADLPSSLIFRSLSFTPHRMIAESPNYRLGNIVVDDLLDSESLTIAVFESFAPITK
jgi:hypothetical protein